jgi:hypothetical protein
MCREIGVLIMTPDPPTKEAVWRLWDLLAAMDTYMSKGRNAELRWTEVSAALGLNSTRGRTITQLADEAGVTRQAISKGVTEFLRMARVSSPAFGLKSAEARRAYQHSNGRRDESDSITEYQGTDTISSAR